MQDKIVPQQFMLLNKDMREHIAKAFDVKRSGITEILDQTVIRDGRTIDDLSAINVGSMSAYTGVTDTFGKLWELTIAKAIEELNPVIDDTTTVMYVGEMQTNQPLIKEEVITPTNDTKKNKQK